MGITAGGIDEMKATIFEERREKREVGRAFYGGSKSKASGVRRASKKFYKREKGGQKKSYPKEELSSYQWIDPM